MKYSVIFLGLMSILSCKTDIQEDAKETTHEDVKISWSSLKTDSFALKYPSDWELDESGLMQSRFFLYAPAIDSSDLFRENINLIAQGLPAPGVDLAMIKMFAKMEIKRRSPNAEIHSMKNVKLNGTPSVKAIFSGDVEDYKLKFMQYYTIKNEILYVLTYTAEQESYDNYRATAQKILSSFEFY